MRVVETPVVSVPFRECHKVQPATIGESLSARFKSLDSSVAFNQSQSHDLPFRVSRLSVEVMQIFSCINFHCEKLMQ